MHAPLVYVALSPALVEELSLEEHLPRLAAVARVERWPGPGNPPLATVADALVRATVVITGWGTPTLSPLDTWTPESFAVRAIVHSAGTVKYFLPQQAVERGLVVAHANESLAEAVAEFTIGAIIAARRQMLQSANRFKTGQSRMPLTTMREIPGSTVGVIGASQIGRRVLRYLAPFNATVLLADPYCPPAVAAEYGATLVDLPELMRRSDIVTLHAPVTPETLRMLGPAEFGAMKDGALFVNTARGRLIDPDALLAELQTGRISAVLDVTDPTEPLPPDSPFFALENCIVFPHIAAITVEARQRQGAMTVDEVLRFLAGEPLHYQVMPDRWATMA